MRGFQPPIFLSYLGLTCPKNNSSAQKEKCYDSNRYKRQSFWAKPERLKAGPPVKKKLDVYSGCQHKGAIVDPKLRVVTCESCKAQLDPVEVLLEIAHHYAKYEAKYKDIKNLERQARDIELFHRNKKQMERDALRAPEEKGMSLSELQKHHHANGCPPLKIKITPSMLECYCGVSLGRVSFREWEAEVLKAQNRERRRLKLKVLEPAKPDLWRE